jgi:hypothetical protein
MVGASPDTTVLCGQTGRAAAGYGRVGDLAPGTRFVQAQLRRGRRHRDLTHGRNVEVAGDPEDRIADVHMIDARGR